MRVLPILIVFSTSVALATSCPDAKLRQVVIGGDTIAGIVLPQKPLKFAEVRLYDSSGKTAWVGTTDKDGDFKIRQLHHGTYRLNVHGWGSTTIRLDPKLDKLSGTGQAIGYGLQLLGNECVAYIATTD